MTFTEQEYALLARLNLLLSTAYTTLQPKSYAADELEFIAELMARAFARGSELPPALANLDLSVTDIGPILVLAHKIRYGT